MRGPNERRDQTKGRGHRQGSGGLRPIEQKLVFRLELSYSRRPIVWSFHESFDVVTMERLSISPSNCHISRHILFFIQNNSGERINSRWLPYFLTPRILFQRALGRRRIRYYYINRSILCLSHHPFCIQSSDYCAGVCRSTKETARSTDDVLIYNICTVPSKHPFTICDIILANADCPEELAVGEQFCVARSLRLCTM